MTNWTNLHPNFTNLLQAEWEDRNFTYEQTKEWIDIGLQPTDYDFAEWLNEEGYTALAVLNESDEQALRTEYQQSLIKQPLFAWYYANQLTASEFNRLAQQVANKSSDYSWKELQQLLTKTPATKPTYRLTKLALILALAGLAIYLLIN